MKVKRPHYIDINIAKRYRAASTVCYLEVNDKQAELFDQFWRELDKKATG